MKSFFQKVFPCFVEKRHPKRKPSKRKYSIETSFNAIHPFIGNVKVTKYESIRYILPSSWMRNILKTKLKGIMYANNIIVINNEQFIHSEIEHHLRDNISPDEICLVIREFMVEVNRMFDIQCIIQVKLINNNQIDLSKAIVFKKANFEAYTPDEEDDTLINEVYMFSKDFKLIMNGNGGNGNGANIVMSRQESNNKHSQKQTNGNHHHSASQIQNNDVSLKFSQIDKEKDNGELQINNKDKNIIHVLNVEQPLNRTNNNQSNGGKGNNNGNGNTNTQKITSKKYNTNSTNDKTILSPQSSGNIIHKGDKDKGGSSIKANREDIFNIELSNYQSISLEPKGLYNPSVYCFMNTCLQCLCSIPELNFYFMNQLYKSEKRSKKRPEACNAFCDLVLNYNKSKSMLRAPESIYDTCHSFLESNRQHDCQEFLRRLLGTMQDELNYNKKYIFPDNITQEKAWIMYREVNPSFIDSIFTGLMRSSVKCCKCGYASYTYDPFLDLSLSIDRKSKESLKNCLSTYFQEEKIDCEYKCSSCKKKTSIKKKLDIALPPPILTIQFKRFAENSRKINTPVYFEPSLYFKTYTNEESKSSKTSYELIAVAVHLGGSISSGHYVAYVNRNDTWYCCNDNKVSECSESDALSQNAYLLFYRQG